MDQEQANDSRSALLQRWLDVLHRWEEKRSQYQIELDKTTDVSKQQELVQGIESCEHVIQTSQGLIQALSDRNPQPSIPDAEPLTESWLPPDDATLAAQVSLPSSAPESSPSALAGLTPPGVSSPFVESQSISTPLIEGEGGGLDLGAAESGVATSVPSPSLQPWQVPSPSGPGSHPATSEPSIAKRWLQVALPVFILLAVGAAMFRPKNVCKLDPNGAYSNSGLALWVRQALTQSQYADSARTVSIGQYGCTIELNGTVASIEDQRNIMALIQDVQLPSQAPIERIKRSFGLESAKINPVQGVVSKLKITGVSGVEP